MNATLRRSLLTLLFGFFLGGSVFSQTKPLSRLPIVKTWGDLEKQKPIRLENGCVVRLGIQKEKVSLGDGALVYCLCTGFTKSENWEIRNRLGPAFILPFQSDSEKSATSGARKTEALNLDKSYLFVFPLVSNKIGKHVTQINSDKKLTLGQISLDVTSDPYHPWTAVTGTKEDFGNLQLRAVIPGWNPADFWGWEKGTEKKPLPLFDEPAGEKELGVECRQKTLIIKSNVPIVVSRPESRFLIRWWIGGKPYVPVKNDRYYDEQFQETIVRAKTCVLPIDAHLRAMALGAKNKLSLQVLYCETGWTWPIRASLIDSASKNVFLLSNKVEFALE